MKTFALLILFPLALAFGAPRTSAQSCTAATCNAASPSETDFLAALPSSSNRNATVVVNIPSGTAAWTTGFSYTVPSAVTNLTIQGATTVNCAGSAGTSSYSCTATDNTVIQDSYQSNNPLVTITLGGASTHFRMTGLTFEGGSISPSNNKYNCLVNFSGASQNFRVDNSHFNNTTYSPAATSSMVRIGGSIEGVMDHNVVDLGTNSSDANGFQTFNDVGDSIGNGDGAWANSTGWGTSEFLFMENNQFNGGFPNDCTVAGRFVMRYNTFNGSATTVQTHATKSDAGSIRGCRGYEYYHNYVMNPFGEGDALGGSKGGPALVWGNTMAANSYYRFWAGSTDRQTNAQTETNTPNGWGYCGTSVNGNGVGSAWDGNSNTSSGYPCLDGIGRGQTVQTLNGANLPNRLNSSTRTIAWPHQLLEPVYLWENSFGSAVLNLRDSSSTQNTDVFVDNPNFNGATGTGFGAQANRPSSCTPGPGGTYYTSPTGSYGVAYFASDANGGQGELYVCTSTNTWTPIYEPYTYPHPLVAGGTTTGNPPNAPASLTVTVQ